MAYNFCPVCGNRLEVRLLPDEDRERLVCISCSHIHYINPIVVAGTIPVVGDRVWLLRRAIEPRLGSWTFPSGFMEMGESVEQAAIRETREELNMQVKLGPLLNVYSRPGAPSVLVAFLAEALSQPSLSAEALEYDLFAPNAIPWDDLAFPYTRAALLDWTRWHSG